jgi:phosphoenolpyruvate synthase/pyruvate phosphate dikinase
VSEGPILPLGAAGSALGVAGGKGANLSQLVRAGFPVPRGFIVTTEAYRACVAANDLDGPILRAIDAIPTDDPSALAAASQTIRSRFTVDIIPPSLAGALCEAYAQLGRPPGACS